MLRSLLLQAAPLHTMWNVTQQGLPITSHLLALTHGQQQLLQQQQQQQYCATPPGSGEDTMQPADQQGQSEQEPSTQQQQQQVQPRPILPTHMILKVLLDSQDEPPNSHQLWVKVQQEYADAFRSRGEFKKYLHNIVKRQLAAAKPPTSLAAGGAGATAAAGQKKGKGKGAARLHYVYIPTHHGKREDLYTAGSQLQQAARKVADEWTARHLPSYQQHLAEGRIPITPDNAQLLEPQQRAKLFVQRQQQQQQQQHTQQQQQQQ